MKQIFLFDGIMDFLTGIIKNVTLDEKTLTRILRGGNYEIKF